ncbi:MAG: hypothetical protein ACK5IJ_10005 [Mangrovibacterium sp.]
MRKYILGLAALVAFASCQEDALTPSFADENRAYTAADMSKPIVKKTYDDFNCGLLYEYDENLDFRYTAENTNTASKWNSIDFPMMNTLAFEDAQGNLKEYSFKFPDRTVTVNNYADYVNASLSFIDSTLFRYFDASKAVGSLFPSKILLSNDLVNNAPIGFDFLQSSDSRSSDDTSLSYIRSVYNRNSIIFLGNLMDIAPTWEKYKKDNLYVFIYRMLTKNKWIDQMPEELFPESVTELYGDTIGHVYGYRLTTSNVEKEIGYDYIPAAGEEAFNANVWYLEKGFIDSYYFNKVMAKFNTDGSITSITSDGFGTERKILIKHFFSSKTNDVLSFLNELIHRKAESNGVTIGWNDMPEAAKSRAKGFAQFYIDMGIDIIGINPDVAVLFEE